MSRQDNDFMTLALELAQKGRGAVEPNPMVGAVIVRHGIVIGRGYHARFGGPHAEIQALADARAQGHEISGSTLYVTLEPCCHHGKTPPCADALIAAGFSRVVAAMQDPDVHVAGKGFTRLRGAGIEVVLGVLEPQAQAMLAPYVKLRTRGRPWVICKWAQSLDGKIATHTGSSQWITGPAARQRAHRLRGQCDGVAVGIGTLLADDPLLTNRTGSGKQPARLVLDTHLRTPPACQLLQTRDVSPVLIAAGQDAELSRRQRLIEAGAQILPLPAGPQGLDLEALLDELGRRQWAYLLVEGGRGVLSSFLRQKLADELAVFVAPCLVGGQKSPGPLDWAEIDTIDQALALPPPGVETIENDLLLQYVFPKA